MNWLQMIKHVQIYWFFFFLMKQLKKDILTDRDMPSRFLWIWLVEEVCSNLCELAHTCKCCTCVKSKVWTPFCYWILLVFLQFPAYLAQLVVPNMHCLYLLAQWWRHLAIGWVSDDLILLCSTCVLVPNKPSSHLRGILWRFTFPANIMILIWGNWFQTNPLNHELDDHADPLCVF